MGKKVYAIKEGFDSKNQKKIENLIVDTWNECLFYVKGVKGAKYKSFKSTDEAEKYLSDSSVLLKKSDDNYPKKGLHVYVDGSYNSATEEYSYGLVAVEDEVVLYIESGKGKNHGERNTRQIAGELKGALRAVEYAIDNKKNEVVIFHDYEGVSHHATGFWERREESSKVYYDHMQRLMGTGIKVTFVKVDSHTGDLFNELVDEKCKEALNIDSDKVVEKWLKTNTLLVNNLEVKNSILKIASDNYNNIKIRNKDEITNLDEIITSAEAKTPIETKNLDKIANSVETKSLRKTTNSKDKKNIDFDDIVKKYMNDNKDFINNIKNLNEDEKTEFIMYLLKKYDFIKN